MMSRSTRVREDMFIDAAKALARCVSEEERGAGTLMPPVAALQDVSGERACWAALAMVLRWGGGWAECVCVCVWNRWVGGEAQFKA